MAEEVIGQPVNCDLERSEGDTDDIVFHFTSGGANADTTSWAGTLSIGDDNDTLAIGTFTKTYTGTGSGADGNLAINMDGFDVPKGNYKYDLRVVDGSIGDSPARVYVKGKLKVTPRID